MGPFFTIAFDVDPGIEVISKARAIGGTTKPGEDIHFLTYAAEDIDNMSQLEHGSVNLITAGVATCHNSRQQQPRFSAQEAPWLFRPSRLITAVSPDK